MMIAHKCDESKLAHASAQESNGRKTNRSKIVPLTRRYSHACTNSPMQGFKVMGLAFEAWPIIVNPGRIDAHDG
jgi:hypothetical protein